MERGGVSYRPDYGGGLGARSVAARPGVRVRTTDWGLLLLVFAFLIVGLGMVYSASYGFSIQEGSPYYGSPFAFFKRQAICAVIGLVALLVCSRIDYHAYKRLSPLILVGTVLLLLLTLIVSLAAARRGQDTLWRYLFGNAVQPSEVAKLGGVVYIAAWLTGRGADLRKVRLGLVPFAVLLGTIALLIVLQQDISTATLLVVTATAMLFVAGAEPKQMLLGGLVGVLAVGLFGYFLVFVVKLQPAVDKWERIRTWLDNPLSESLEGGFQVVQTLAALNLGGLFGRGLGQSSQKFFVYAPHTDCIISIIGEETGFVGTMSILALYAAWTWRGLRIAWNAVDVYGRLLAVGTVTWVTAGAILHVAVNTSTVPFTGDVLPFISAGGSSLITNLAAVGILLNIARTSRLAAKSGADRARPLAY